MSKKSGLDIPMYNLLAFNLKDILLLMLVGGFLGYIIGFAHCSVKLSDSNKNQSLEAIK